MRSERSGGLIHEVTASILKRKPLALNAANAALALDADMPDILLIDAGGGSVTVTLPTEASMLNRLIRIYNTSDAAENLTVKEDSGTTTFGVIFKGGYCDFYCNGTTWFAVPSGSNDYIIGAGLFTTVGGDATESITVAGAVSTDVPIVTVNTDGGTPRTVTKAICTTNAITVTMSGDPSTVHVLNYLVIRPQA